MKLTNIFNKNRNVILVHLIFIILLIFIIAGANLYFSITMDLPINERTNHYSIIEYKMFMSSQFPTFLIIIILFIFIVVIFCVSYFILKFLINWNREKKSKTLNKRQKLLNRFYRTDKKIEKKDYHPKIINSLENIIQESKSSNFKDIQEIASKKLEFCRDTENIGNLELGEDTRIFINKKVNYLAEKAEKINQNNDYLRAINYWKEVIDLYYLLLEISFGTVERTRLYLKIFNFEKRIIRAYINRSEKYCILALNLIKKHKNTQAKEDLLISIDSYQNTIAEVKKYKILFENNKDNKILWRSKRELDKFNILITSKGVKIRFFNREMDLEMHFPSENETLSRSIQLCFNTIEKLKESLIHFSIISNIPNKVIS